LKRTQRTLGGSKSFGWSCQVDGRHRTVAFVSRSPPGAGRSRPVPSGRWPGRPNACGPGQAGIGVGQQLAYALHQFPNLGTGERSRRHRPHAISCKAPRNGTKGGGGSRRRADVDDLRLAAQYLVFVGGVVGRRNAQVSRRSASSGDRATQRRRRGASKQAHGRGEMMFGPGAGHLRAVRCHADGTFSGLRSAPRALEPSWVDLKCKLR
jgi:hypothetical protein